MPVQVTPEASTIMFVALGVYFAVVLIIGVILERLVRSISDYFLGGRRLGPYVIAFSERASEMSGWVGLGLPGEGFTSGINATWNTIGCFMGIGDLGVWTLMAKRLRRYTEVVGALTIPAYLEARFNDTKGVLRFTSAVIIILFLTAYVGAQFTAAAKVFSAIAGGGAVQTWIVIGAIIMILYTVLGGFFAVCWTDFVQGWWALIGLFIITGVGLAKYGGFGGLFQRMAEVRPVIDLETGARASVTLASLNNFWGYEYVGVLLLVNILAYIAIGFGWPGNPHMIVRFMGIKRVKDLKKAAVTALLLLLVVYYLAESVGWLASVEFNGDPRNLITPDPEYSLQSLAIAWLPPAVAGIVLAAPLALMMSTADSQLLVSSSAIMEDIYHRFINPKAEERKLVLWSRIITFLLGIVALLWALFFGESVYLFVLFAWGGLGSAFGPLMLLSLRWKRITTTGAFAGLITGAAATIIWKSYTKNLLFPGNANWWIIAIMLPIVVFILTAIGATIIEGSSAKGLKAAVVATVVSGIVWILWCYGRLVADPDFAGWWYELLIAFPLALLTVVAVSYVSSPLNKEFLDKTFKYMTSPAPSELAEAGAPSAPSAEGTPATKILIASEFDVVKAFIKTNIPNMLR